MDDVDPFAKACLFCFDFAVGSEMVKWHKTRPQCANKSSLQQTNQQRSPASRLNVVQLTTTPVCIGEELAWEYLLVDVGKDQALPPLRQPKRRDLRRSVLTVFKTDTSPATGGLPMDEQSKNRKQLTKEERRLQAERATLYAQEQGEIAKRIRDEKTARLRALRLAATRPA